jgi:endonuclease III
LGSLVMGPAGRAVRGRNSAFVSPMRKKRIQTDVPVKEVANVLRRRYGDFAHGNRKNPLNELLFIICSTKTSEANYQRAYLNCRRAFPTFAALSRAKEPALARSLRIGGLYHSKARLLKGALRCIVTTFGRPTLVTLRRMSDAECEKLLVSLPGVGTKVARCVMMYALGRQVFPVDTHCWRICLRLGWIRPTGRGGVPSHRDMNRLQRKISAPLRYSLHVNFLSLGREICTARAPNCKSCPINYLCRKVGVRADDKGERRGK